MQRTVPGIAAVGLVDLERGEFVEVAMTTPLPDDWTSYVARAARSYFEGDHVRTIRSLLASRSSAAGGRRIEEVILRSAAHLHVMVRLDAAPHLVLAVVTRADTKLGLVLSAVQRTARGAELALPRSITRRRTNEGRS